MAFHSDRRERHTLQDSQKNMLPAHVLAGRSPALYLILLSVAAGCGSDRPATVTAAANCTDDGELTAEVYGAIESTLEWRGDELECDGMPRPHGAGARLRFAGPAVAGGETSRLTFIIALPGLRQGQSASELAAGVTLIEETAGVFFSTPEPSACWADIEHQVPLHGATEDDIPRYRIAGLLYCLSPLAEVNGKRSVTLSDLRFSGRLDWREPE